MSTVDESRTTSSGFLRGGTLIITPVSSKCLVLRVWGLYIDIDSSRKLGEAIRRVRAPHMRLR